VVFNSDRFQKRVTTVANAPMKSPIAVNMTPGAKINKPAIIRATRTGSVGRRFMKITHPSRAHAITYTAIAAKINVKPISIIEASCPTSAGLNTNANGTRYLTEPRRMAVRAVRIGGVLAILEAANDARATGGVM